MRFHERKQGVGVVGRQIAQPHILERGGCVPAGHLCSPRTGATTRWNPCVRLGWQQDFKIVFPARRFPHGSHGLSTRQQRTELGHAIRSG